MPRDASSPPVDRALVSALLADHHDLAALLVRDGVVAAASAVARRLFARDPLVGADARALFTDECRDKVRAALEARAPAVWELQVPRARAEEVAVRFLVAPLGGGEALLLAAAPGAVYSEEAAFELIAINSQLANAVRERSRRTRELEAARAELERLGRLRDEATAALSHDLRSPLAAMRLVAGELARRADRVAPGELREAARKLERIVDRALALVDDVLAAARAALDEPPRREPMALDAVARDVIDTLEPLARAAGVRLELTTEGEGERARVVGDPIAIAEVLSNLLANAIRHTRAGTSVRVHVAVDRARARASVEDCGPGVAPDERERIFDRFRQGGPHRGAAGLGLFVARRIVERHGGRIWVESPEIGARFVFELPR
jgi:two-component system sensor histidine kinase BaeS